MPSKSTDSSSSLVTSPLTWAALLGLVTACGACSTTAACNTDELPPTDPCFQKSCCEMLILDGDGGIVDAEGPGTTMRMCGACNG